MGVIGADEIGYELAWLAELGPRFTGSPAQEQLIHHVVGQFVELGLDVRQDDHEFTRWDVPPGDENLSLTVDGNSVDVSAAFPYSGTTGVRGARGRLRRLRGPVPLWALARNQIAVVEVNNRHMDFSLVVDTWDPSEAWGPTANPLAPATMAGLTLGLARRSGVRAVVFAWRGVSAENARGQYLPFTLGYHGIPAVFVAGAAADQVLGAAARREFAKLVLNATVAPNSSTRTVWTAVPGTKHPDESVLVMSHSDGPNNVEENGHLGLVALARDLVANPPERTVVLVFTTGHLRIPALTKHGQATTRWLEDHPDQWAGGLGQRQAVAGLAIEHLGAIEYADDPASGTYAPTGFAEPELLYATTRELTNIARAQWQGADPGPTRVSKPSALIHFGEGEPMYLKQVPGISLVTTPQYLLADNQSDFVDAELLARQVDSFARVLRCMDTMPRRELGRVQLPSPQAKAAAVAKIVASLIPVRMPALGRSE